MSQSIVGDHPLRPPTDRRLGRPLPYQLANRTQTHQKADYSFHVHNCRFVHICGISSSFELFIPHLKADFYALLTRPPLGIATPFDLHV